MIPEIAEAITQKYQSNTNFKNALTGGLYFLRAPQEQTGSYCIFGFEGFTQTPIMGVSTNNIINVDLRFDIFTDATDGGETLASLVGLLSDCYNEQRIYCSGYNDLIINDENILPLDEIDGIWQTRVTYNLIIQKE